MALGRYQASTLFFAATTAVASAFAVRPPADAAMPETAPTPVDVRVVNRITRAECGPRAGTEGPSPEELVAGLHSARNRRRVRMMLRELAARDPALAETEALRLSNLPQPPLQLEGFRALGDLGASSALIRISEEGLHRRRQWALRALALAGDGPALGHLVAIARDRGRPERVDAIVALGQSGAADAVAPLIELVEDHGMQIAMTAAEALGALGLPEADRALLEVARSGAREPRIAALRNLPPSREGLALLNEIIRESPMIEHVEAAAQALVGFDSEEDRRGLFAGIEAERDPSRRVALLQALTTDQSSAGERLLLTSLEANGPNEFRTAAGALLARESQPGLDAVLGVAADPTHPNRLMAMEMLSYAGHGPTVGAFMLDQARHPEDSSSQQTALGWLTGTGHPETLDVLRELLDGDESQGDRVWFLMEQLGQLGSPEAVDFLHELARSERRELRLNAINTLARRPEDDPRLEGLATDIMRDGSVEERQAVVAAVAGQRAPWADEMTIALLHDSDPIVAATTLQTVGHLASERVQAEILAIVHDPDSSADLRRAAMYSLSAREADIGAVAEQLFREQPEVLNEGGIEWVMTHAPEVGRSYAEGILEDPSQDIEVRRNALTSMFMNIPDDELRQTYLAAEEPELRVATLQYLEPSSDRSRERFVVGLDDEDEQVRSTAWSMLAGYHPDLAAEHAESLMRSQDEFLASAAARFRVEHDPETGAAIARDTSLPVGVRAAAAELVADLDPGLREELLGQVDEPDPCRCGGRRGVVVLTETH